MIRHFHVDRVVAYNNSPAIIETTPCRLLQINDSQLRRLSFIINNDIFSNIDVDKELLKNNGYCHIVITRNYYPDVKKYDFIVQLTMALNPADIEQTLKTLEKPPDTVTFNGWLINPCCGSEHLHYLLMDDEKMIGICNVPHHLLNFCVEILTENGGGRDSIK